MSLERVEVTHEVLLACLAHAHSTEAEEVMGLLLGDVQEAPGGGGCVCRVSLAFPQIRTDRRKDRVESSPEQMARCAAHAERLGREAGARVRVVGWYHSHPHITVLPSHVDVRTQAMYQLLDPGFAGLIISAFNRDAASQANTVQLTAFQSLPADGAQGGPMVRKEVAVALVAAASPLERSFGDLHAVCRTLVLEEEAAAREARSSAGGGAGPGSELQEAHHSAVLQAHLVRLVDVALRPALAAMHALAAQHAAQARQLAAEVTALEGAAAARIAELEARVAAAGGRVTGVL